MLILYLFFTMFYGFESSCRTIENVTCCADELQVYQRRNILMLHNFPEGKKCLFHFFYRNYGFMYLLSFCWLLKNVIIHWRTMGDMTITPFLSSHPQRLFKTAASTYRHLQRIYIFTVSTFATYPHLQPINIFNLSTSSTYQHLQRINIFNVSLHALLCRCSSYL